MPTNFSTVIGNVFPIDHVRSQFPAVNRGGSSVFFDNAAGAQIPQRVFDAVNQHLLTRNVQRGGPYRESQEVDSTIAHARQTVASFLNAADPNEIAFGMNATSFIRLISLAIGQSLADRREIIVSDLDHEANIATWLALERDGAVIRWWHTRDDGSLDLEDLKPLLSRKTRLVACTVTSNALGTIVNVSGAARLSHAAGAELFLDCVHYAPHGPVDVQAWQCDYLVCSGYKIFAPHMGFLWGKRETLDALPTFREDFIPNTTPSKIEVGTFVYENVAGMTAAIEYLEDLGRLCVGNGAASSQRQSLEAALGSIREYEMKLSRCVLEGLENIKNAVVYGEQDKSHLDRRVPTFSFNLKNIPAREVAASLARRGFAVRDGHMYSPRLIKRLGLSPDLGLVRASLVHYNTEDEINRFLQTLADIAA
jgi:cysteine desulfurase family protein (TIGR01976 family)